MSDYDYMETHEDDSDTSRRALMYEVIDCAPRSHLFHLPVELDFDDEDADEHLHEF